MKQFSLLVKPVSADCNLRCPYCFYLHKSALYPDTPVHRMSFDILETMIASYMSTDQSQYAFAWQGGEPLLAGIDFYRRVVALQRKYGKPGAVVVNGLQTNGMLIDDELAELFSEYKFLLGVSLDGPPAIHDGYRVHADGRGTHASVMDGIDCLRKHQVEFNVLVLVTDRNVTKAHEVYRYLRDNDLRFQQYIPCVEFDDDDSLMPFSITGEQWGRFLCDIFDAWIPADTTRVSIRLFDALMCFLATRKSSQCSTGRNCQYYFVVEHIGDVYPCDFYVEPSLRLGNVEKDPWKALAASPVYREFGSRKGKWNTVCAECEFVDVCAGDCLKHRPQKSQAVSCLCSGWKKFFEHALPDLRKMARRWAGSV